MFWSPFSPYPIILPSHTHFPNQAAVGSAQRINALIADNMGAFRNAGGLAPFYRHPMMQLERRPDSQPFDQKICSLRDQVLGSRGTPVAQTVHPLKRSSDVEVPSFRQKVHRSLAQKSSMTSVKENGPLHLLQGSLGDDFDKFIKDFNLFQKEFPNRECSKQTAGWYGLLGKKFSVLTANLYFRRLRPNLQPSIKNVTSNYRIWVSTVFSTLENYHLYQLLWVLEDRQKKECAELLRKKILVAPLNTKQEECLKKISMQQIREEVREFATIIEEVDLGKFEEGDANQGMLRLYQSCIDKLPYPYQYYFPLPGYDLSREDSQLYWNAFASHLRGDFSSTIPYTFIEDNLHASDKIGELLFYIFNLAKLYRAQILEKQETSIMGEDEIALCLTRIFRSQNEQISFGTLYFATLHIWWEKYAQSEITKSLLAIQEPPSTALKATISFFQQHYGSLQNIQQGLSWNNRCKRTDSLTHHLKTFWKIIQNFLNIEKIF
jgi:hypothetical protein